MKIKVVIVEKGSCKKDEQNRNPKDSFYVLIFVIPEKYVFKNKNWFPNSHL